MGDFGSLQIAYSGLRAQQKRMNIIGENIANVETPGYHKQRVELAPVDRLATSFLSGAQRAGGGVEIADIARLRDTILSNHARHQGSVAAQRSATSDLLVQLEQTIGGLDSGGLHDQMTAFFNSFDDLAGSPEDPAIRNVVLQRGETVVRAFSRVVTGINELHDRTFAETNDTVRAINSLSEQIASADDQISRAVTSGGHPNALFDTRDSLVDELATLADIDVIEQADGKTTISLDGFLLVSNGESRELSVVTSADPVLGPLGYAKVAVHDIYGRELTVTGGELAANLQALATVIPDAKRDVNTVAQELSDQVNAIHNTGAGLDGSTGLDFFNIDGAGVISISTDVAGQPELVAAAAAGAGQYDNSVAIDIAQLADGPTGPLAVFVEKVGSVASAVATATSGAQAAEAARTQAEALAMAAGGVSLDEELTELITAQRSYEAAARLMTAIDEMLGVLIERTGVVGR
jgi:flagellar hook-associated protein 1 FlgK